MIFERLDSHCHRKISLSRSRRTNAHYNGVLGYSINIFLLSESFCLYDLSRGRNAYSAVGKLYSLVHGIFLNHGENISEALLVYVLALVRHCSQSFHRSLCLHNVRLIATYAYIIASAEYDHAVLPLQYVQIFIKSAEKSYYTVHRRNVYYRFRHITTTDKK